MIHSGYLVWICNDARCTSRRAELVEEPNLGFVLKYKRPTGSREPLMVKLSAETFVNAEIEAHNLGFTIDYGAD